MPITQSAKKALRQNTKRRVKNLAQNRNLKDAVKEFRKTPSKEALSTIFKKLDKSAKVGLIKDNKADRLKSRLSTLLTKTTK
ncbi:MAG: 30S ribosomal protein S20 [Candidatus Pacebacteria bacterium]|nr:30S ribosomal protein S20 [Candidatus Paceibacterota bacterium]